MCVLYVCVCVCVCVQVLDKIMETPGKFIKFILKCFSDCSPSVKSGFVQLSSYCFFFLGNWILEMFIKVCCNFWSCILVILPDNPPQSPTVPIRQFSLCFRVLVQ